MRLEEQVSSLRDLAVYVADNADKIYVAGGPQGRTRLSKLPTKKALRAAASIVVSGKVPLLEGEEA